MTLRGRGHLAYLGPRWLSAFDQLLASGTERYPSDRHFEQLLEAQDVGTSELRQVVEATHVCGAYRDALQITQHVQSSEGNLQLAEAQFGVYP